MAHASRTMACSSHCEERNGTIRKDFERVPSYSESFQSGCIKNLTSDLNDFVAEFEDCVCHENPAHCPVAKEKHQLLGRMVHLFQDACNLRESPSGRQRSHIRQQSSDSSFMSPPTRPFWTNQSFSQSYESGYSSQSSIGSLASTSLLNIGSDFVIWRGYMLIINNVWFDGMFCPRHGTKAEGERMKKLFQSFGFDVDVEFNCSSDALRKVLKEKTKSSSMGQYDCFAILILSHGTEDGILCTDNKEISYKEIMDYVKADKFQAMGGKPKLIFSQACRGINRDAGHLLCRGGGNDICSDGQYDSKALKTMVLRIPTDSNILIVYATTPGRVANKDIGFKYDSESACSWFLDALCQVLDAHSHNEDLLSMLTRVNNHVAMLGDEAAGMQIPSQFSTLTRRVFLRKIQGGAGLPEKGMDSLEEGLDS